MDLKNKYLMFHKDETWKDFVKYFNNNNDRPYVDIKVMAENEIANGTRFSKESIEDAVKNSLGLAPIVTEWLKNDNGSYSLGTHGGVYEVSDKSVVYKDTTFIVGVIPENPHVEWKNVTMKNGVDKYNYLTTKGVLYKDKYPEIVDYIFKNNANQSMEIYVEDGYYDDKNVFNITKFKFSALCALNRSDNKEENVEPAFEMADIIPTYLNQGVTSEEFKKDFMQTIVKEFQNLGEALKKEMEEQTEMKNKNKKFSIEIPEKYSLIYNFEDKTQLLFNKEDKTVGVLDCSEDEINFENIEVLTNDFTEYFTKNFTEVQEEESKEEPNVEDELTTEENQNQDTNSDEFKKLETQVKELTEAVKEFEKKEKLNIVKDLSLEYKISEDNADLKSLKDNISNYSKDDLNDKLMVISFKENKGLFEKDNSSSSFNPSTGQSKKKFNNINNEDNLTDEAKAIMALMK